MVRNNDLSFSFLYFDKSGPSVGAFRDRTEVWNVRTGQPCLTLPEWLWAGINQPNHAVAGKGQVRTMDRVKVRAWNT